MDIWGAKAERALEIIGKVNFEQLKKHMTSGEKQSDSIRADNFEDFKQGLESSYNAHVTAAEMSSNVEIAARVGGKITLKLLSAKNDKELPDKGVVTRAVHARRRRVVRTQHRDDGG